MKLFSKYLRVDVFYKKITFLNISNIQIKGTGLNIIINNVNYIQKIVVIIFAVDFDLMKQHPMLSSAQYGPIC